MLVDLRRALSLPNDGMFAAVVQPVRYRRDAGPRMNDRLAWSPYAFRWNVDGGDKYDYFIIRSNADVSAAIFKERLGSVELVAHEGWWWLYRNVERPWPQLTSAKAAN